MFKVHIELEDLDARLNQTGTVYTEITDYGITYQDAHRALDRLLGIMGLDEITDGPTIEPKWYPEDDIR